MLVAAPGCATDPRRLATLPAVLELDHAIYFVPGDGVADLTGFTLDPGMAHVGQGTRNRRVVFARSYLELAWIEQPAEVAAQGLDFVDRCARPPRGCPFGCVLRGPLSDGLRARCRRYEVPGAGGFALWLVADAPAAAPFLAIIDTADPAARWPSRRASAAELRHACGATQIRRTILACPVPVGLDELADVELVVGPPRLTLELDGMVRGFEP